MATSQHDKAEAEHVPADWAAVCVAVLHGSFLVTGLVGLHKRVRRRGGMPVHRGRGREREDAEEGSVGMPCAARAGRSAEGSGAGRAGEAT